jgi:hypothetical protein
MKSTRAVTANKGAINKTSTRTVTMKSTGTSNMNSTRAVTMKSTGAVTTNRGAMTMKSTGLRLWWVRKLYLRAGSRDCEEYGRFQFDTLFLLAACLA